MRVERASCFLCALLVGAVFARQARGAEPNAPDQTAPDAAPEGPRIVIVLDVKDDATANAELRAELYEVARTAGYTPAGKLDIEGVAARESLMREGSITTDEGELARLRSALDVPVLVRVARDGGGARVTLIMKRGGRAQVLHADAGSLSDLGKVFGNALPPIYNPKPEPARKPSPNVVGGLLGSETPPEPEVSPRDAWLARGGARASYGAVALFSATQVRNVPFSDVNPQGDVEQGRSHTNAIGGGVGVRVALMYVPVPDPNLSTGGFFAFRLGVGVDNNVFYARKPVGYDYGGAKRNVSHRDQALYVASLPLHLGFAVATGNFPSPTVWRGVLLGLAYAPAAQFSMDLNETSGKFRFNPAGAEATVDIAKMDAEADGSEMQIRAFVSGLVPLDDEHPGLISMGLGAVWY